jgi:hypothetical protein
MKRDSTTLFLECPNTILPLPWSGLDNVISSIESAYQNPTREVGIASWQSFLASGNELEVIDPVPIPTDPDWIGLIAALEPYFNIGLAANYVVFTQCFNMLVALQTTTFFDSNRVEWRNFVFNLNLGKDAFSSEPDGGQRGEIESIFSTFDIPFTFEAG